MIDARDWPIAKKAVSKQRCPRTELDEGRGTTIKSPVIFGPLPKTSTGKIQKFMLCAKQG
jgi:hypothetical protein